MRSAIQVASLAFALACAPRPDVSTSAARVPPPVGSGHQDVQLASYGVVDVRAGAGYAPPAHTLHVRIVVHDPEPIAWTLDVRAQRIALEGRGEETASLAAANAGTPPPVVTIASGQTRVVDLFYLLPADLQSAMSIPSFDLLSSITAGDRVIAARTPFTRLAAEPVQFETYDYGDDHWSPPYWHAELPSELSTGTLTIRRNAGIHVGNTA